MVEWLTQPLSLVCLLLALCTLCAIRGSHGRLAWLNLVSFALLWLLSTPELANRWIHRLEADHSVPAFCANSAVEHVVVLGGGINPWAPDSTALTRLNPDSIARAMAASTLDNEQAIWFTQGAGANGFTLADDMADILIINGIPETSIVRERNSRSTQENAAYLEDFLPTQDSPTIHLVTSALHLNRATSLYRNQGYKVCPVEGVHSRYSVPAPPISLLPYLSGLEKTTVAWREQLARLKYRITS